ncbi:Endo-1,4-beta-xylanase, GH35 family [Nannocystis exedens]|uniref:Beta-xylanase n=1 Tax=Nannocystis exedens TaxID=54 RepID=A0A1I2IHE3_9BACT|nr:endo-1,4-beta-xylanase [Nannocystis exedens]PCC73655.1 glycoside hydrolase [Nannocystis exedens]SFF41060.1 Endo-1,4-beta-xylanase, GH35 family [Nannocystis exedens]
MTRLVLLASLLSITACAAAPGDGPDVEYVRPVVVAEHPVALDNPQEETVVWPIWGGAFTPDEPVSIRAVLAPGGAGASGLVIAGPGEPEARAAVELTADGGAWALRERAGDEVIQERTIAAPAPAELVVTVDGAAVEVRAGDAVTTLRLAAPLAPAGEAAGLYVHLDPGATLELREIAMSQALPAAPELGTPLRELAEARGIEFGSAIDIWPPLHDLGFEALLAEQFSAAAPTELYWATTRGEDRDYFFVPADLSINYATVHGQAVTGMFLVWDFELPGWVTELGESGDAEALGAVFDEHITTLVSRYRGKVDAWIVVNEAIWGPDETGDEFAEYAWSIWSDVLGVEFIERAFRTARAADPEAVLLYNETGAEALGLKSDFMHEMAADLVARGAPIDGIGLQFHVDAAAPPDLDDVRANMERIAALGLDIYITELDVSIAGTDAAQLELQADIYAGIVGTCLAVPACRSTTVFGFSDRYAWDELGDAAPLLFDADYAAKPAFRAVQRVLEGGDRGRSARRSNATSATSSSRG